VETERAYSYFGTSEICYLLKWLASDVQKTLGS